MTTFSNLIKQNPFTNHRKLSNKDAIPVVQVVNKQNKLISKFIGEQSKWKKFLEEKQKQIAIAKSKIKHMEVKLTSLVAIFAVAMTFSLVTLLILTPLAVLGITLKVPYLMWSLGVGGVVFGVSIGSLAIKSSLYLTAKKNELEKIRQEKRHFQSLLKNKEIIGIFFNFDKLLAWDVIELTVEQHTRLVKSDYWKQSLMLDLIDSLDTALQYEKNHLVMPLDLQKTVKETFNKLHRILPV